MDVLIAGKERVLNKPRQAPAPQQDKPAEIVGRLVYLRQDPGGAWRGRPDLLSFPSELTAKPIVYLAAMRRVSSAPSGSRTDSIWCQPRIPNSRGGDQPPTRAARQVEAAEHRQAEEHHNGPRRPSSVPAETRPGSRPPRHQAAAAADQPTSESRNPQ
jgi:hypothetical protein